MTRSRAGSKASTPPRRGPLAPVIDPSRCSRPPGPSTIASVPDDAPSAALLDLRVEAGPTTTIALVGELDPATAPQLDAEIERLLGTDRIDRMVLDLAELTFLDSSGLRVFVTARELLTSRGGELVLQRPSANTQRLLDITGLGEIISVE